MPVIIGQGRSFKSVFMDAIKNTALSLSIAYDEKGMHPSVKAEFKYNIADAFKKTEGKLALAFLMGTIKRCLDLYLNEYHDVFMEIDSIETEDMMNEVEGLLRYTRFSEGELKDLAGLACVNTLRSVFTRFFDDIKRILSQAELECRFIHMRNSFYRILNEAAFEEWSDNSEKYSALLLISKCAPNQEPRNSDRRWQLYSKWLLESVREKPMMGASFSLSDVYTPLPAWRNTSSLKKEVFEIDSELKKWALSGGEPLLICGGPGFGKSTVAKNLACYLIDCGHKVIFVPLKHIFMDKNILEAIAIYVSVHVGIDSFCLSDLNAKREERIFLFFDGLDELNQQGENAKQLVRKLVENLTKGGFFSEKKRYTILLGGRDEILSSLDALQSFSAWHLLPYFTQENQRVLYEDPKNILARDRREEWRERYLKVGKQSSISMQDIKNNKFIDELSLIPVLNYLITLAFSGGESTDGDAYISKQIVDLQSKSELYDFLVRSIFRRFWDDNNRFRNPFDKIELTVTEEPTYYPHRYLTEDEFVQLYAEIGCLSWQNEGRPFGKSQIDNCIANNKEAIAALEKMDWIFDEDNRHGALILCFYLQWANKLEGAIEFTHKSFWEHLAVEKIVRYILMCVDKWEDGIDEQRFISLFRHAELTENMWEMLRDRIKKLFCRLDDINDNTPWQICSRSVAITISERAVVLFSEFFEKTHKNSWNFPKDAREPYRLECMQASILEWAIINLVGILASSAHRRCDTPSGHAYMACIWGRRKRELSITGLSLAGANLCNMDLESMDLSGIDMQYMDLRGANLRKANMKWGNLRGVDMRNANCYMADISYADLTMADLDGTICDATLAVRADFRLASFIGTSFRAADLRSANLCAVEAKAADFREANIDGISAKNIHDHENALFSKDQIAELEKALVREQPII